MFPEAEREVASLLLWWYDHHPHALPSAMKDFSELPWHALKALGYLMFSHEDTVTIRRDAYRNAYTKREWEPWEEALRKDFGRINLWEQVFHWAMSLIHEIGGKEKFDGDILQESFNFLVLHETVVPLPRSNPYAFPAREFNDLVWMNWKAREIFRARPSLYPDRNGASTITLCEQKGIEGSITALFIARRDYTGIGDILAVFSGYEKNAVGDLTGMAWVKGMNEKAIFVLALAGFFLDTFNLDDYPLPADVLAGIPKDPLASSG